METPAAAPPAPAGIADTEGPAGFSTTPPTLDPKVTQVYLPLAVDQDAAVRYLAQETRRPIQPESIQLLYEPAILGVATIQFLDRKKKIEFRQEQMLLTPGQGGVNGVDWNEAENLSIQTSDLRKQPAQPGPDAGPFFADAPEQANQASKLDKMSRDLSDWLYYNARLKIQGHADLELFQQPGERERDFKIRLQQAAREQRDQEVDKLKRQYEVQLDRLRDKKQEEEQELVEEKAEHAARQQQEVIGIGETVLSWVLGGRSMRGLSSAAGKRRMTARAGQEVAQTEQAIAELKEQIGELEQQLKEQSDDITMKWAHLLDDLVTEELAPRRTDVDVQMVALTWLPSWQIRYSDGEIRRTEVVAAYQLPEAG
jgi:hypothetical protein